MRGSLRLRIEQHPPLARILPFALLLAGIALDGAMGGHARTLPWDLRWDYAARSACALIALLWLLPALPELRPTAHVTTGPGGQATLSPLPPTDLLLGVVVGVAVLAMWIWPPLRAFSLSAGGFDAHWLGASLPAATGTSPGSGFTPMDAAGHVQWALAATRLAGSTLVVPVAEELFWRSFLMRWLDGPGFLARDPRSVGWRAFALQALLFGSEHELWLAGVLAGLAYGWLYRRTGRLWPSILAHAVTNGLLGMWVLTNSAWSYW